jgi:hypothetical protein
VPLALGLAALLLVAVLALGSSCCRHTPAGSGRAEVGAAVPAFPPADSMDLSLSLDAGSYAVGERVRMRLVARNTTARTLALTFRTAQRHDFIVRKSGRIVWQWSTDMMFAQVVGTETLPPGDSLAFAGEWDQRLADGTNAALGAYTVQGVLKTAPERATPERRFGVVD